MKLSDFGAAGAQIEMLMRSVKAGRIPHALLFSGPHGTGKRTAARFVAQAIYCPMEVSPCGNCPACKRFLSGNHPDVHVLSVHERSIGVDLIRELREKVSLRPFSGARHIAIIEQAEKMTTAAQNALLKTLEEPAGDTVFFLITDSPGALLPTIVSRVRRLRFSPLSIEVCAEALAGRGIDSPRALELAGLAHGSVGRALEIHENPNYALLREKALASLAALNSRANVAKAASMLSGEKESAADALEILEVAARDRMAAENGAKPHTDVSALRFDGRRMLLGIIAMRKMLASNVSWQSALERTYLSVVDR